MEWIAENWFLIVVILLFAAMHMFGHGGHGGHKKSNEPTGDMHEHDSDNRANQNEENNNKHHHH